MKDGHGCLALLGMAAFLGIISPFLPEKKPDPAVEARQKAALERRQEERSAERLVKLVLRDPDTASFTHIVPGFCGLVNARNGFGGMTGEQRFLITSRGPVLEEQANPSAFEKIWKESCVP